MKWHPVFLVSAALVFSLVSCTKEVSRENPTGSSADSVNFYATIDGVPWKADSLQQVSVSDSGILSITGIGKTQDEISILLPALQKGVYELSSQSSGYALYASLKESFAAEIYLSNGSADESKAGGTVTITEIDSVAKTISGTFQFKLYDASKDSTKTVTAGFFNKIPYSGGGVPVLDPGGPAGGGTTTGDTLSATVDTSKWVAAQVIGASQSGKIIISGFNTDGSQSISLAMPSSITAGSYTLNVLGATYLATYSPDASTQLIAEGDGTLTITSNDAVNKHIQGQFNFSGVSLTGGAGASITSGYFSCNY